MIQVVFMDGRQFINKHDDFRDDEVGEVLKFVEQGLKDNDQSIIQISKWVKTDKEGHVVPRRYDRT